MSSIFLTFTAVLVTVVFAGTVAEADEVQFKRAIKSMAGCYLVDYNYTETESLKPGMFARVESTIELGF